MDPEIKPCPHGRFEIVVSGSGGQGIILCGKLLAEAAAVHCNRQAAMTPCYGPEVRGGVSTAELVIDSVPIDYPKITAPDIMIALSQSAMDKYNTMMAPDALLIVNETLIKDVPSRFKSVFTAPFSRIAVKVMKAPVVANMIALGAFAVITQIITREALMQTILKYVPEKVLELDRAAVDKGIEIASESGFSRP